MNWHKLTTTQANEIIEANKNAVAVASLEEYAAELIDDTKSVFGNVVGQDSLTRFDQPQRSRKKRKKSISQSTSVKSVPIKEAKTPSDDAKKSRKPRRPIRKNNPNAKKERPNTKDKPNNDRLK